jgi:hypothetical protein
MRQKNQQRSKCQINPNHSSLRDMDSLEAEEGRLYSETGKLYSETGELCSETWILKLQTAYSKTEVTEAGNYRDDDL